MNLRLTQLYAAREKLLERREVAFVARAKRPDDTQEARQHRIETRLAELNHSVDQIESGADIRTGHAGVSVNVPAGRLGVN